ncbi:uncharacterized protein METZ01_LOCUS305709 [marine metagenome]|uniref:Uncharacterized protein n=1 Tax=marine metagenome TaxID=408172 RepID=A0A382MXJ8_9ZZZZ
MLNFLSWILEPHDPLSNLSSQSYQNNIDTYANHAEKRLFLKTSHNYEMDDNSGALKYLER